MSITINDIKDTSVLSSCCGAPVYTDMEICTDCKEYCDVITENDCEEVQLSDEQSKIIDNLKKD